jgi:hypothetical protein
MPQFDLHGLELSWHSFTDLFAEIPSKNLLRLEQLHIVDIDATVDQMTLPHLTHLTSLQFYVKKEELSIARKVWTSLQINNVKLSDVSIEGIVTKETISYLSSFSGLKRLVVRCPAASPDVTLKDLENMLISKVLPRHINSLQVVETPFGQWVKFLYFHSCY